MARAIIHLKDINMEAILQLDKDNADKDNEIPPIPQWQHIRFSENEPTCGEILVSFAVSEHDYNYFLAPENVKLEDRVKFNEYEVDMLILGLRGL